MSSPFRWHALDLMERNLIPPFGLKLRRPRRFMIGDMLRHFKVTAVLQVGRMPGLTFHFHRPNYLRLARRPKIGHHSISGLEHRPRHGLEKLPH